MVPHLPQGHGSISITIQDLEIATDPGDALRFLSIQATVPITVGFLEMPLQARAARR